MKSNIFKICLVSAALLIGGTLVANAVGFISYEPDSLDANKTQMVFWDNVRMINKGLKMSSLGINDLEDVEGGSIKIADRDLYVRKYMGFICPNYPQSACQVLIGDLGGSIFLKVDSLEGDDLALTSESKDIILKGSSIDFKGKVILTDNKNLIVTSMPLPNDTNSVFTTNLETNNIIGNPNLTLPNLFFETVNSPAENNVIKFEPKRIINIELYYNAQSL